MAYSGYPMQGNFPPPFTIVPAAHAPSHADGGIDEIASALALTAIPDLFGKWELLKSGTLTSTTNWDSGAITTKDLMLLVFSIEADSVGANGLRMRLNEIDANNYSYLAPTGIDWWYTTAMPQCLIAMIANGSARWRIVGWVLVSGRGNVRYTPIRMFVAGNPGDINTHAGVYDGALTITSMQLLSHAACTGKVKIYGVDL